MKLIYSKSSTEHGFELGRFIDNVVAVLLLTAS
jgi:hypothetical protein